jgi:hypothetical protein
MKARALIACIAVLAAFAFLAACQPDSVAETDSCMECHSGEGTESNAVLAAQDQYDNSGHFNGPRIVEAANAYTYEFAFEGGNSLYCNGNNVAGATTTNCSRCHTHQGFVDFIAAGMPPTFVNNYSAASQPGCFTCHKPHVSGDFSMRKESAETLVDGTTVFSGGKGNLCVTCHKSLTAVGDVAVASTTAFFSTTTAFPLTWRSSSGMHHGPQADFMLGKNSYPYAAKTYVGQSVHLGTSIPDSCVTCHMYGSTDARAGFSLELGGHGMYLTADVHGQTANVIGGCRSTSCHTWSSSATTKTAAVPNPLSTPPAGSLGSLTGGFETSTSALVNNYLDNIRANRDLLIAYFGNGTANFGGAGAGAIEGADDHLDQTTGEFGKDWVFAQANLTATQSFAFWNFRLFIEDRSQGIHNPAFAYQILYDAAEALGLTPVGSRP